METNLGILLMTDVPKKYEVSSSPTSQPRAMVSPQDEQATGISHLPQPCVAEVLLLIGLAKKTEIVVSTYL